jgi:hypothetical protein
MAQQLPLIPLAEEIIEIAGQEVTLKRGRAIVVKAALADFLDSLAQQQSCATFPDGSPLPDGVRFVHQRGTATVVVLELFPQVREVQWISNLSPQPFGPRTQYEPVTLAFPYIVIFVLFQSGCLTGFQQLFYRAEAISSENDALFFPNLLNVSEGYGQKCWLCLANMTDVSQLPWNKKVHKVLEHVWEAGFNKSSEHFEKNSYWQKTTAARLDLRLNSVESWQAATKEDPLFMLKVKWKPAGLTVGQVVESMLAAGYGAAAIKSSSDLITLICSCAQNHSGQAAPGSSFIRMLLHGQSKTAG